MDKTLKEVFDKALAHVNFDKRLADRFYNLQVGFVNKNEEHMTFFGGKLLGVQVVRFTPSDLAKFYDILEVDDEDLAAEIEKVPDINQAFVVSSDTFNLTCLYCIHRFLTSQLPDKKRYRGALDVALLLNYRYLTGIMAGWFKYPADPKTAQATYANLSYKFLIKKLGSWQEVMVFRADSIVNQKGLHYKELTSFENTYEIVKIANDTQGRIKDMIKNIYREFVKVHESGQRIYTSSGTMVDTDGEEVLKDRVHGLESYETYIVATIQDKGSFIKSELVSVIVNMMFTMQERGFVQTLEWISDQHSNRGKGSIEDFIRLTIVHSYNYMDRNRSIIKNTKDLPTFLSALRGAYMSSRSTDPDLMKMRKMGEKIVKEATGLRNEAAVSAIRTGIFLYICLRTYTKNHYNS